MDLKKWLVADHDVKPQVMVVQASGTDWFGVPQDAARLVEATSSASVEGQPDSTFDLALLSLADPAPTDLEDLLAQLARVLKPNCRLVVRQPTSSSLMQSALRLSGFSQPTDPEEAAPGVVQVTSRKPDFEVGSSIVLKLPAPKPKAVWKLDDMEDEDLVDPDSLLDADDLKRPDPASLRTCGTTGKRKACKDCSCGLAEELAEENGVKQANNLPKSSCGSCYLGDAFRCAGCPYAGMPAFKPGERIVLSDQLLKPDL